MPLVFRETNLFTAAASMCGVTLEPTRPTPPSVCAPTDRTPPPVCGLPRPSTGPPLRSVGLRWALKPRSRPVHYKMTLVLGGAHYDCPSKILREGVEDVECRAL